MTGFESLKKRDALLTSQLQMNKGLLVKKGQVQNLVSYIALHGDKAGIDLLEYTPLPVKKKKFFMEIPLSIFIRGRFHDIFFFLEKISNGKTLVLVEKINMKSTIEPDKLLVSCIVKGFAINGL